MIHKSNLGFAYFAVLAILFVSCEDDSFSGLKKARVNGEWQMKEVLAGKLYQEFEPGDITWNFSNSEEIIVDVSPQVEIEVFVQFDNSGSYEFSLDSDSIYFNINSPENLDSYKYYFDDGDLILEDRPEVDGPRFVLEKP